MSLNMLLKEEVSRNGATAGRLRVIYPPAKYKENGKLPVSDLACAAENPKKGGDTRNPDCKHMCFHRDRSAQRVFL